MLAATRRQYERQVALADQAVIDAKKAAKRGTRAASHAIIAGQAAGIEIAQQSVVQNLAEQGLAADATGALNTAALVTPPAAVSSMIDQTANLDAFERLTRTLVADAVRTATSVDMARRRNVTVYVRSVGGNACARCAILSGRVYRWSDGFQRHPNCQCCMIPTTYADAYGLEPSPAELFRQGRITDLSRADTLAINNGADIAQVVNVRRKAAGLIRGSSVIVRAGRPTPAGIFQMASSRDEAVRLLERYGYIT